MDPNTLYSDPPPEICHNWDPVSDSDPSRLTGFHNQLFENAKTVFQFILIYPFLIILQNDTWSKF